MSRDISAIFSLKDNFSNSLKNISSNQKKFKQELENTSKEIAILYDKKRQLKLDNKAADKAIKDTMKNAEKFGSEYEKVMKDNAKRKLEIQFETNSVNKKIKDIETKFKNLSNKKATPKVTVKDDATKVLDSIGSKLQGLGKGFLIGAAGVAVGAVAGVTAATKHSLDVAAEMEQTSMAFETMLGNKDKSDKFLNSLKSFAIQTPFEFNQLTDSSKKMLAYGFKSEDIIPTLTAVGNASSGLGLGADGVDRITIALGQMLAKTKVSGEEMKQLTEAGVPAWDILSKATHKTTAELMKLSEKGAIPADKAVQALVKGMNTKFPDMMIKQSRTLRGLWSSMKDFVNLNVFGAFGNGIRQGIEPFLAKFVDTLTNSQGGLDKLQQKLMDLGKTMGNYVSTKAQSLVDYFNKLFNDPAFQNASLGGKVQIVLDDMYLSMQTWFDGGGGKKIKKTFENAMQGAIDVLVSVVNNNGPKFVEIGIEIGGSIGDGIVQGIDKKLPLYDFRKKYGLNVTLDKELQAGQLFANPVGTLTGAVENLIFGKPKAFGMQRVPYDNYPTLLHEGEKVLTKQEANSQKGYGNITIAKLADTVVIREEADIHKLATEFVIQLSNANMNLGGAY